MLVTKQNKPAPRANKNIIRIHPYTETQTHFYSYSTRSRCDIKSQNYSLVRDRLSLCANKDGKEIKREKQNMCLIVSQWRKNCAIYFSSLLLTFCHHNSICSSFSLSPLLLSSIHIFILLAKIKDVDVDTLKMIKK